MKDFDYRVVVAVLLAFGVCATLVILAYNEFRTDGHVTTEEANLLSVLGGAAIGAVAAYLGGAGKGKGGGDDSSSSEH